MSGWIKTHRKIMDHWLRGKPEQFVWWMDILFETNYADKEWAIGDQVFIVKRGECLYSLDTWAKRWNTDKSTVRRFLLKLKKCKMIEYKNETVTVRITVCNYATYQHNPDQDETHLEQERNGNETHLKSTKERKKERSKEAASAAAHEMNFTDQKNQVESFRDGTTERWYEFTSIWITTEDPAILHKNTKKKYWDKLTIEIQDSLIKMVKNLGSDMQYLKTVWISECFKNKGMNSIYLKEKIAYQKSKSNSKIDKANKDTTHNFSGQYE